MKSFLHKKLSDLQFTNGLAQALADAEKGHGAEIALLNTEPVLLEHLRKSAIITSTIASCAIEGIHAPNFEAITLAPPSRELTREERELNDYRTALDYIYRLDPADIRITPDFIRNIHRLVMDHAIDAGEYKRRDNEITEELPDGTKRIRFKPVSFSDTEQYMDQLCLQYNETVAKKEVPELIAIAALTLDLTAIHPFPDGNGRVSRVITSAALLSENYQLPKYISLEEIIDHRSDAYYDALKLSSDKWHTNQHRLEPFLTFQTKVIAQGYHELELRRQRCNDPITVVFHERVPTDARQRAWEEFVNFYPAAMLELTNEGIKETDIKGFRSDLPKEEWDRLNHAGRLIRHLLANAVINQNSGGSGGSKPGGGSPGKHEPYRR